MPSFSLTSEHSILIKIKFTHSLESASYVSSKIFQHDLSAGQPTLESTASMNSEKFTSLVLPTLWLRLTIGNAIPVRLDRPFYNLQYLELAAVKLAALPEDFASKLPNIRILNLSYNSLKDVRPLRGMTLLKRLFLIGNRLSSLSDGTTDTLLSLCELQVLDLRCRSFPLNLLFPCLH